MVEEEEACMFGVAVSLELSYRAVSLTLLCVYVVGSFDPPCS